MATNKDFIVKNGLSVGEDISVSGSVTSNLQFDNSVEAQFGTNSDLQIYSDGSNSYVKETGAGALVLQSAGPAIVLEETDGTNMILANTGGAVTLYHAGSPKLETTTTGVDITGNAVLTGELRGPASFVIDPAAVGDNTGEVVIKGDLTVEGTQTTVNSTTLDVVDKNITLNHGSGDTSASADGAGITIQDAVNASTDATILWNTTNDRFDFSHPVSITGNLNASGDIIGSSSLQIFRSSAGAASVLLQRNGAAGPWSLAQGNTSTDYFEILEGSTSRMTIANGGATTFSGNLTSNGTITGADYSGITMGGSLSGSHDDAKVQYGNSFSGTPAQGHFFFDALNQKLKVYTGSAFVDAVPAGGGGGGGSGSSDATATFRKYTYTLTGTTNAISGKEDDEVTTGDFISGRLYEITTVGDTNFTSIGASSNTVGVQFTATDVGGGTTGKAKEVLFYATGGTQNIEVYVNGVKAVEGASNDYVATTGTSVTFTSNLSSGDVVDIQVYELLTNDSYYLKTETYTQTEVNSQIATGTSTYLPLVGGTLTGNLNVGSSGANALFTAYGGASARPTFVHASGYGGLQLAGTGAGSGPSLIFSNNWTNGVSEEYTIFLDGATDDLVFISGDPADISSEERMRLTDDGKLGINTSAPTSMLEIKTTNQNFNDGANAIRIVHPAGPVTGDVGGGIVFAQRWYTSSTQDVRTGGIYGIKTHGSGAYGGGLAFYTQPSNANDMNQVMVLTDDKYVGIGTNSPLARLHVRDSAQAGAQHTYIYDGSSVTVEATEPSVQLIAEDSGTHGGSYLWRYGNNTFAAIANPTDDTIDFTYGVSNADDFQVHAGTNMTSYLKVMSIGSDGNVSVAGNFTPVSTSQDIGSTANPWRNIYTQDLVLSNEKRETGNEVDGTKGNWTIQEGEEHLYIINNKSGKKYKFALEEIE